MKKRRRLGPPPVRPFVPCPCCHKPMDTGMVVCWVCYRRTDRLTTAGSAEVERWELARQKRTGWATS